MTVTIKGSADALDQLHLSDESIIRDVQMNFGSDTDFTSKPLQEYTVA